MTRTDVGPVFVVVQIPRASIRVEAARQDRPAPMTPATVLEDALRQVSPTRRAVTTATAQTARAVSMSAAVQIRAGWTPRVQRASVADQINSIASTVSHPASRQPKRV